MFLGKHRTALFKGHLFLLECIYLLKISSSISKFALFYGFLQCPIDLYPAIELD